MYNEIKKVLLSRLRNEDHYEFHSEFVKVANQYSLSASFLAVMAIYNDHYDELDAATETVRKSDFTRLLEKANALRTNTYRRLRFAVRGFLHHAEEEKQNAAFRITAIMGHYGNVPRMSRDKKTASLKNLAGDLREQASADLQLLGLTTWLSELEEHNRACRKLKYSRSEEREARHAARKVDEARVAVDAAYRAAIREVETHRMLNPADENGVLMAFFLNDTADAYNYLVAQREGFMTARRNKQAGLAASSSSSSSALALV